MEDSKGTGELVADDLTSAVYAELRQIAGRYLQSERANQSLPPTVLVHEVYLRLRQQRKPFQNRNHLCGVAAGLMRLVLLDHARRRKAAQRAVEDALLVEDAQEVSGRKIVDFFLLDDALTRLAGVDPKLVRLVELRFFGGLTIEETADEMAISAMAVKRDWQFAKAWLYRQLS